MVHMLWSNVHANSLGSIICDFILYGIFLTHVYESFKSDRGGCNKHRIISIINFDIIICCNFDFHCWWKMISDKLRFPPTFSACCMGSWLVFGCMFSVLVAGSTVSMANSTVPGVFPAPCWTLLSTGSCSRPSFWPILFEYAVHRRHKVCIYLHHSVCFCRDIFGFFPTFEISDLLNQAQEVYGPNSCGL